MTEEKEIYGKQHELKILPEHFNDVSAGYKKAEIRFNDRGYASGDILILREWSQEEGFSGRKIVSTVMHILDDREYLKEGYVMLSIEVLKVW